MVIGVKMPQGSECLGMRGAVSQQAAYIRSGCSYRRSQSEYNPTWQRSGAASAAASDLWTADSGVYIIFRHSTGTAWDSDIPFRGSLPKNRRRVESWSSS